MIIGTSAARGLLLAAASSASGKTTLTLGLLRAFRDRGVSIFAAKSGPDYIDPRFHDTACGGQSVNLDAWAMTPERLRWLVHRQLGDRGTESTLLVEGAMGLFDAGADGRGSSADLSAALGVPALMVMDVRRQGQTAAAIAKGLSRHRNDVPIAGVILNRIGSARHEGLLRRAFADTGLPVLGAMPECPEIRLPSRHLGLIQAAEQSGLEEAISAMARTVAQACDLDAILALRRTVAPPQGPEPGMLAPLGRRIAIARDAAFAFTYPHILKGWQEQGAMFSTFSPLSDEAPADDCDAVYLPGGYPELHAATLASASQFHAGMKQAARRGAVIYGECGGYMTLGHGIVDADGERHAMLGLLPLETSFAKRRRQLGYRQLRPRPGAFWSTPLAGHEFHYCSTLATGDADPLFDVTHSEGGETYAAGMICGNVQGSFMHVIDVAD